MELKEFKQSLLPLRPQLLREAYRLIGHMEDAEDAIQEAYLRLWEKRDLLDSVSSVEAYAVTVTRHICTDLMRQQPHRISLDELPPVPFEEPAGSRLEAESEALLIRRLIDTLPPLQRRILLMKEVEDYESEEIAEIIGCHPDAVRANLSRARRRLRACYLKYVSPIK